MECARDVPLFRLYHSPKDDLARDLVGPLLKTASIMRRHTGDIRSTAFSLFREELRAFLEANKGGGKILWLSSHRISNGDVDAVKNQSAYVFGDLLEALRNGPAPGQEGHWCRRVLATLLQKGILEWRVVLTLPGGIYHQKGLILDDRCGHRVYLSGSWNESLQAYTLNSEKVDVHKAWEDEARCREALHWFEDVWNGKVPKLQVLPVEKALEEGWIERVEDEAWRPVARGEPRPELWTPELLYLAIQDKLPPSLRDPYAGTLVEPLPHQVHVYRRILSRPPFRFLLADEVGLGKTIEAGLVLSSLTGSGTARRVLVLAPKNVLNQWHEELWEKFQLPTWTLEGDRWINKATGEAFDVSRPLFAHLPGPAPQIMLVSRSLAMRRGRRDDFKASLWDVVVLDEAHRARSRRERGARHRNNLLQVLDLLEGRTTALLLLTATPVQLDLSELYDLLHPLGLPPDWSDPAKFEDFIRQLGAPDPLWRFLIEMATQSEAFYRERYHIGREEFDGDLMSGVRFFEGMPQGADPEAAFRRLLNLVRTNSHHEIPSLSPPETILLRVALYRMSPLYQLICRNTRELLRRYRSRGIINVRVPERELGNPPVRVDFTKEEADLYQEVTEKYIRPFYKRYSEAGLPAHSVGFVLSIYAKRAASSWAGLRESLRRRLKRLKDALETWEEGGVYHLFGSLAVQDLVSEGAGSEEVELVAEGFDFEEETPTPRKKPDLQKARRVVEDEKKKVGALLDVLEGFESEDIDSKKEALRTFLRDLLAKRRGAIVFSQFKDTIDDLANALLPDFRNSLAKYHGEGGEVWDGSQWKGTNKTSVEKGVSEGKFRVLLATDAASEGLNLQAMDAVVNYDLPWNPMRVEQRIGRVDRLNQVSATVHVNVVLPAKTIEETVYQRCVERIGLFRQALGPLQPILIEDYVQKALLEGESVEQAVDRAIDEWSAAKTHAELFEKALAALTPDRRWEARREAEARALEHLLAKSNFRKEGELWVRGAERVTIHGPTDAGPALVAASHNPVFGRLLAELGARPDELKREQAAYKVVVSGDRLVLAVEPSPGGGWFLVRDLTRMDGQGEKQVGTDVNQVRDYVRALEDQTSQTFKRFREQQERLQRQEWRKEAEKVFRDLLHSAAGNAEKAAEAVVQVPVLTRLWQEYEERDEAPVKDEIRAVLRRIGGGTKRKGQRPKLETLKKRADELLSWFG